MTEMNFDPPNKSKQDELDNNWPRTPNDNVAVRSASKKSILDILQIAQNHAEEQEKLAHQQS